MNDSNLTRLLLRIKKKKKNAFRSGLPICHELWDIVFILFFIFLALLVDVRTRSSSGEQRGFTKAPSLLRLYPGEQSNKTCLEVVLIFCNSFPSFLIMIFTQELPASYNCKSVVYYTYSRCYSSRHSTQMFTPFLALDYTWYHVIRRSDPYWAGLSSNFK